MVEINARKAMFERNLGNFVREEFENYSAVFGPLSRLSDLQSEVADKISAGKNMVIHVQYFKDQDRYKANIYSEE